MLDRITGSGRQNDISSQLSDLLNDIANRYKLDDTEYKLYIAAIEKHFPSFWKDLSPMVGKADVDQFMNVLCLSLLGVAIPCLVDEQSKYVSDEVVKASRIVNELDRSTRPAQSNRSIPYEVGIARNTRSHNDRGSSFGTTARRNNNEPKKPTLPIHNEDDMYEPSNYTHDKQLPHVAAPLKQIVGSTKPLMGTTTKIRIKMPSVNDHTELFDKDDHNDIDQLTHEPSVISYQLDTVSDLINGTTPTIYKWWVEEHMVYSKNPSTPEDNERVAGIFDMFKTVNNYDALIDLIRELSDLGKTEIIMWLSNRVTDETLNFIQRNYECADKLVCTSYLRKPVEACEELAVYGIKVFVVDQILNLFRKLFKNWAFLELHRVVTVTDEICAINKSIGISTDIPPKTTYTTVILRYSKIILALPVVTMYYKYGIAELEINNKSLYVLSPNPCVATNALDALIQDVFAKYSNPHDHELLIIDRTLTMYRTFKLRDEPPTEVFYEIERIMI